MAALESVLNSFDYYVTQDQIVTKTGLPTSTIYSRDYGIVSGIQYEDDSTFENLTITVSGNNAGEFRGVQLSSAYSLSESQSSISGINSIVPSRVSSMTSSSFNGAQLNSDPDLFNSAQNLAAGVAQTLNQSNNFVTSLSNNSGVLNFQNSLDLTASSLANSVDKTVIGDKIKADLALLFPGVTVPGLVSILDNSDAAIRAQQAAEITLPTNIADNILTRVVGLESSVDQAGELLTAAQLRLASITETALIQSIGAGASTSSSQLLNSFAQTITATGSSINLPGTDASLSSVNTALGGTALAQKVKEVESQLNLVDRNALYSTNNFIDRISRQASSIASQAIEVSFDTDVLAQNANDFLVKNVPFVGSLSGSLTETALKDLGTLGLAFTGSTNAIVIIAGQALTAAIQSIQQQVSSFISREVTQAVSSQVISSATSNFGLPTGTVV